MAEFCDPTPGTSNSQPTTQLREVDKNSATTSLYLNHKSEKKRNDVSNTYNLSDRKFKEDQRQVWVYKVLSVWW